MTNNGDKKGDNKKGDEKGDNNGEKGSKKGEEADTMTNTPHLGLTKGARGGNG